MTKFNKKARSASFLLADLFYIFYYYFLYFCPDAKVPKNLHSKRGDGSFGKSKVLKGKF